MARKRAKGSRTVKVRKIVTTRTIKSQPIVPTTGKYKGQRVYRKGGKIHTVSMKRDLKKKAKRVRKRTEPSYTGDVKGKRF